MDAVTTAIDEMSADSVLESTEAKTVVLFSDGTGNHSGKLHKTNVWRMYQTIDLGVPERKGDRIQIGRYDNGIANSSFRLLAMIQGIFGWGLKRNILSLYLFLCRNYRPGDSICLFGFSRGAFTMRVLADLIDRQKILSHTHGEALSYLVEDAYRDYRRGQHPRMWPMRGLVPLGRWIMRGVRWTWRTARFRKHYADAERVDGEIAFLGAWDTVSAYGGPILEIIRAVDDWVTQISFSDKSVPACVRAARHALALDDERDSFQPLPWDESATDRARLTQVWFAGMHSDVGGGYPDDSLSYVSFIWMLDEASAAAGLRFRPDRERDARLQADSFGPIHNSRSGLGGYYRYQPRNIAALMWPAGKGTESLRDPEQPARQGMRRPALIHDSVFRRIRSGTDGYAPLAISKDFEIVEDLSAKPALALPAEYLAEISSRQWQEPHAWAQERVWDWVWAKRIVYFLTVGASLMAASAPLWLDISGAAKSAGGLTELLRVPWQWLTGFAPDIFDPWLDLFIDRPWVPVIFAAAIWILSRASGVLERILRVECRGNWREASQKAPPSKSPVYRLRTNRIYQHVLGFLRWQALPSLVGLVLLTVLLSLLASALTVARLTWSQRDDIFCQPGWPEDGTSETFWMSTADPCNRSSFKVTRGQAYDIILVVPPADQWHDGDVRTNPQGIRAGELLPFRLDWLFAGMRRAPRAPWMQPLAYIVDEGTSATHTQPLPGQYDAASGVYRARFVAELSGRFAIAVNEAVPPWPLPASFFYDHDPGNGLAAPANRGRACVRIAPADKVAIDAVASMSRQQDPCQDIVPAAPNKAQP
ncbi:DUF2235 domain-containing protein [Sphingosinicella sp. LHD-64]|uniref:DUF2235 domain-containing protein n=1 Tax=Sphingosinicella sp. LHD-64 TaxID=3072139 RepID=UPI00280CC7C7|nr:DUF2235 domain-containing protein [Sphingosinicella sp. LHD-64]MDQ8758261.1 DUF2235 domain-containing protein [Sphingosinicella sp. LHD-64]